MAADPNPNNIFVDAQEPHIGGKQWIRDIMAIVAEISITKARLHVAEKMESELEKEEQNQKAYTHGKAFAFWKTQVQPLERELKAKTAKLLEIL